MTINTITQVYMPAFNVWGRPVTFYPLVSQPGLPAYSGRGIYSTQPIDVGTEDGAILSDARTILDIIETEFSTLPEQGDQLSIPSSNGMPALGDFEILDTDSNGGGETTLTLRKLVQPKPVVTP